MKIIKQILMIAIVGFVSLCVVAATEAGDQRITVTASIGHGGLGAGQTEWMAARNVGMFTVPPNGTAINFECRLDEFSIYSLGPSGNQIDRFRRDIKKEWNSQLRQFVETGTVDTPVPLNNLVLGPGTYFFFVPGKPGSAGTLSLTIRTPGP
jgi:hypothetical protein